MTSILLRASSRYAQLARARAIGAASVSVDSNSRFSSVLFRQTSTRASDTRPTPAKAQSTNSLAAKANALTRTPRIVQYLGYGGAVPFIAGAIVTSVTSDPYPFARATQLYGTSILSFLGAVHWGVALRSSLDGTAGTRDFAYSVVPSLVAWCSALMRPPEGLYLLVGSFGVAFLYDTVRFGSGSAVPAWYRRLRLPLSVAAMGGCAVALTAVKRDLEPDGVCPRSPDALILSTSTIEGGKQAKDAKDGGSVVEGDSK